MTLGTILVLSDSTAAFDTAHRTILLSRLENCAGIKGHALKGLQSYLTDKSFFFFVHLRDYSFESALLVSGIPQGSILGPTLFLVYMFPPGPVFDKYDVSFHCFADVVQIYSPFKIHCST